MKRLVLLILALALIPAIPADGASKVRLASCGDKPSYKPKKVIIACGDGAFVVVKLEWSKWSRKTAVGKGVGKVNTCEPSCAEGKFKSYKVKLTAGKPTKCAKGDRQFTRLTYTFTDKKPKGVKRTESVPRPCNG